MRTSILRGDLIYMATKATLCSNGDNNTNMRRSGLCRTLMRPMLTKAETESACDVTSITGKLKSPLGMYEGDAMNVD